MTGTHRDFIFGILAVLAVQHGHENSLNLIDMGHGAHSPVTFPESNMVLTMGHIGGDE